LANTSSHYIFGYLIAPFLGRLNISSSPFNNAAANPAVVRIQLANGDNTIARPASARFCIISIDPTSTTVKTLKGAGGDTGLQIGSNARGGSLTLPCGNTAGDNIIINSVGADSTFTTIQFL